MFAEGRDRRICLRYGYFSGGIIESLSEVGWKPRLPYGCQIANAPLLSERNKRAGLGLCSWTACSQWIHPDA